METKVCKHCKEKLPANNFRTMKGKTSAGNDYTYLYYHCRKCSSLLVTKEQKRKGEILRRFKRRKGCVKCGYNEHGTALQFDHLDPSTKRHKTQGVSMGWSWKGIKEEISKCQILCANCHVVKTFEAGEAGPKNNKYV